MKTKTKKICGKTQAQIRKSYFANKLDDLLNDMQATGEVTEEATKELYAFLELLEAEKSQVRGLIGKKFDVGIVNLKPPSVEDLQGNIDPEKLRIWSERVEKDTKRVKEMMSLVATASRNKTVDINLLKDYLLEITTLLMSVDQDRVYKDQLYRARMTAIIDKFQMSRAEAEERAKLTKEYRDYKLAVLFTEDVKEFLMAAKKKLGSNY